MSIKGISPLVATVLLIASTIAVAAILSIWLNSFTRGIITDVGVTSNNQLSCSKGGISLSNLIYNTSTDYLTGCIENSGTVNLGSIGIQIVYKNLTSQNYDLCLAGGRLSDCPVSNLTLPPRFYYCFIVPSSDNYDKIRVMTNCSSVYAPADASEVVEVA